MCMDSAEQAMALWDLFHWSQRRHSRRERELLRILQQNAAWVAQVHAAPTVAEEYGVEPPASAWIEGRSGNADATD